MAIQSEQKIAGRLVAIVRDSDGRIAALNVALGDTEVRVTGTVSEVQNPGDDEVRIVTPHCIVIVRRS